MAGMNAHTGKPLGGIAHLQQSVRAILSTPVGSRVERREFGSRVPGLLDAPLGPESAADIQAAAVEALGRHEPRLAVRQAALRAAAPDGSIALEIRGAYDGSEVEFEVQL